MTALLTTSGPTYRGVITVGGHGQDGVERVVVRGSQAAHHIEQFPGNWRV